MWLHDTTPTSGTPGVTTTGTEWYNQLIPLIGQGLQVWNQQQVMDWARQQAAAGTPVNASVLQTLLQQSTPGVNIGLSQGTQNLVGYALLGFGALAILLVLLKTAK